MEKLHFYCQNCTRDEESFNITRIEEAKERIDSNLYTVISYYNICDNCKKLPEELLKIFDIDNYYSEYYYEIINIYNLKLIDQYGFFDLSISKTQGIMYMSFDTTIYYSTTIDKKFMFDTIKDGSLITINSIVHSRYSSYIERELKLIKDQGYEVNLIQTVENSHFYSVKKPPLIKPARK